MYIIKPFIGLEAEGRICFRLALEAYLNLAQIRWADLVVFCRNVEPRYHYILDYILEQKLPFIYDIDDNLFLVPEQVEDGEYYRQPERIAQLEKYLRSASLVRVYSRPLREQAQRYNPEVRQVDPVLDWKLIHTVEKTTQDRTVRLVYATSRKDDYLFPIFTDSLRRLLREYPDKTEMHFLGFQPSGFQGFANVHYSKFNPNYDQFMRRFSSMGFDIGLAPMLDDDFHRSKTNTKFREYGACGIAGIYSKVDLYASCVKDGETGLLVENQPDDWYQAMVRLVEDLRLRACIGSAARGEIQRLYSQERFQEVWWQQIKDVLENPGYRENGVSENLVRLQSKIDPETQSVPSILTIWYTKLLRGLQLLRAGNLRRSVTNGRVHLSNLWWLFKINYLRRV
jgi:glycosyltransferase involved in cell wall biosynthesis